MISGTRRHHELHALALASLLVAALGSGCVTVYQPMVALQQPAVVDVQAPNFEGVRLLVRCIPGDYLGPGDAQRLCRQVAMLFRNQGAEVETEVPRDGRGVAGRDDGKRRDLVIDLSSRLLHRDDSTLLAILSGITFTLVPAYGEASFEQDIVIRDEAGFQLAHDTVQGRFIEYFGAGIWGVNWVLDLLVRPDEDELTGINANREFSRDYYGRLSQLAFNARMRSVVLKGFGD